MTARVRNKRSMVASSVVMEGTEPASKVSRVVAEGKEPSKPPCVRDLVGVLDYGPAPESAAVAKAWLDDHGRTFGHFIGNKWVRPEGRTTYGSFNPATGEKLATTIQGIFKV